MNTKLTSLLLTCLALLTSPAIAGDNVSWRNVPNHKPVRMLNGSYRALYDSMNNGEVTAIRPGAIISYGKPTPVRFDGVHYWQIDVTYKNYTVGGSVLIGEARALVRDDRVVAWTDRKGGRIVP